MFDLPKHLNINGSAHPIKSDFRDVLRIMLMFEDRELTNSEKMAIMLEMLYESVPPDAEQAMRQAAWFIDGGVESIGGKGKDYGRLYSWEQDKIYLFSGIDKVLGYSSRSCKYLHWWDFLGAMMEMGECMFSHIVHMRRAKKENKLTKEERKQWSENPAMYELQCEHQAASDLLDLING